MITMEGLVDADRGAAGRTQFHIILEHWQKGTLQMLIRCNFLVIVKEVVTFSRNTAKLLT